MSFERPLISLEDLTDGTTITYGVVKPGEESPDGVLFIRGGDIVAGRINTSQLRTISKDVSNQYSRTLLRGGELLISLVGNPGEVALVPNTLIGANIARQVGLVRIDPSKADSNYIQFFLRSKVGRDVLLAYSKGSVQQVINLKDLKAVKIPLPELSAQRKIATSMQAIDDRITLLRETNTTLEVIAQALFKSWFVDFDPVRAKSEGKLPEGMDEAIVALFPDAFEETELGMVPKGWKINKLKEIIDLFGGQAFKSKDYISQGIFVLRTNNFKHGIAKKNDNDVFLPNSFLDLYKDFVCEAFDYHLVMVGDSIGKTGMILPHLLPALRNQNMWCFRPKNKKILSRLYIKFIVDKISSELINFASGSARDFFKRDDFKNRKLITPNDEVLISYSIITNPILEKISINCSKMETLNNLRDILLPRLISGKLRPVDVEEINNQIKVTA